VDGDFMGSEFGVETRSNLDAQAAPRPGWQVSASSNDDAPTCYCLDCRSVNSVGLHLSMGQVHQREYSCHTHTHTHTHTTIHDHLPISFCGISLCNWKSVIKWIKSECLQWSVSFNKFI